METVERKAPKTTHFWNKKAPKALESSTFGAFEQLVRMRSAVRIRPAAPENSLFLRKWAVFLRFSQLFEAIKNRGLFLTTALPTDRKKPASGIVCSGGRDSFVNLPFCGGSAALFRRRFPLSPAVSSLPATVRTPLCCGRRHCVDAFCRRARWGSSGPPRACR